MNWQGKVYNIMFYATQPYNLSWQSHVVMSLLEFDLSLMLVRDPLGTINIIPSTHDTCYSWRTFTSAVISNPMCVNWINRKNRFSAIDNIAGLVQDCSISSAGLVQDCNISTANALEILQFCTKPSTKALSYPHCDIAESILTHWGLMTDRCVN